MLIEYPVSRADAMNFCIVKPESVDSQTNDCFCATLRPSV
jgi:hypothetical protein